MGPLASGPQRLGEAATLIPMASTTKPDTPKNSPSSTGIGNTFVNSRGRSRDSRRRRSAIHAKTSTGRRNSRGHARRPETSDAHEAGKSKVPDDFAPQRAKHIAGPGAARAAGWCTGRSCDTATAPGRPTNLSFMPHCASIICFRGNGASSGDSSHTTEQVAHW